MKPSKPPKHVEVDVRCEGKVNVDRCTGPWVHLRVNDGGEQIDDPAKRLAYQCFQCHTVLLTPEQARQIGHALIAQASHVQRHPDIRKRVLDYRMT